MKKVLGYWLWFVSLVLCTLAVPFGLIRLACFALSDKAEVWGDKFLGIKDDV